MRMRLINYNGICRRHKAIILYVIHFDVSSDIGAHLFFPSPTPHLGSASAVSPVLASSMGSKLTGQCSCSDRGRNLVVCIDGTSNQFCEKVCVPFDFRNGCSLF